MSTHLPDHSNHAACFALASSRVVTPDGVVAAAVVVRDGKIEAVVDPDRVPQGCPRIDCGGDVIMPGLIDAHVHINEPGRSEWEGFSTATAAAAAAGVTMLVDMPLNSSPVTVSGEALQIKRQAADGKCHVNVGFYGGLVPLNERDAPDTSLAQRIRDLVGGGVFGIKCFLCDSGLAEFPRTTERELRAVMPVLAECHVPLLAHAELLEDAPATSLAADVTAYRDYRDSRPPRFELAAIELLIRLCREFRCPVHIVHLAAADALDMIRRAREEGLPLTVETCPHYLFFCDDDVPAGDTRFKCAPPIRDAANREKLWQGLRDGLIDTIGSDHSPCPPAMKHLDRGDFRAAWGGIASLQFTLPIVWTAGQPRGVSLVDMAHWCCRNPARLLGLERCKGQIAPGFDADLVIWSPEEEFTVRRDDIRFRYPVTPYEGHAMRGVVCSTYLGGKLICDGEQLSASRFSPLARRS